MKVIDRNGAKTLIDIMKHLDSQVEGKIPSIEGLASEDWVESKGYLDADASKEIHYTKKETDHKFFHKSDLSHLATKAWIHTHVYDKSEADNRFITPTTLRDYWTKADVVIALEKLRNKLEEDIKGLATYEKIFELFFTKDQTLLEIDKVKDNLTDVFNSLKDNLHGQIDDVKDNLYDELNGIKDSLKNELNGDHYSKAETNIEIDKVKDELLEKINEKSDTTKLYEIFFTKAQTLLEIDKLRDTVEQWLHKYALKEDTYSKEHIDKVLWEILVKGKYEGEIDIDFESLAKVAWVRDTFATKEELENIDLTDYVRKEENSVIQDEEGNIIPILTVDPDAEYVEAGDLDEYVRKEENTVVKDNEGEIIPELFVDEDFNLVDESMLEEYVKKEENSIIKDEEGNLIKELTVDPDADYVEADDLEDYVRVETLEEVLEGYVKKDEFSDTLENYVTQDEITVFLTEEDVEEILEDYVKVETFEEVLENYVKNETLEETLQDYALLDDITDFVTEDEVYEILENYVTTDSLNDAIQSEADSREQEDNRIWGAVNDFKEEVETDYAKKSEIPSLEGYATEEWVISQQYLTEHQDISHLVTKDELEEVRNEIPSLNGYATEEWVNEQEYLKYEDVAHFETIEGAEAKYQPIGEYLVQDDLEDYATKEDVAEEVKTAIDNIVDGASEAMDTLKELEDGINKNKDIITTLNEAIAKKADKEYVDEEINKLTKVMCLTQEEYDALGDGKEDNVFYIIYE